MQDAKVAVDEGVAPACDLPSDRLLDRVASWKVLSEQALTRTTGPGWVSSTYPRELSTTLEALIEAEAKCCPFLSFDVHERGEVLHVDVRFPPEFEPMVSAVTGGMNSTRS